MCLNSHPKTQIIYIEHTHASKRRYKSSPFCVLGKLRVTILLFLFLSFFLLRNLYLHRNCLVLRRTGHFSKGILGQVSEAWHQNYQSLSFLWTQYWIYNQYLRKSGKADPPQDKQDRVPSPTVCVVCHTFKKTIHLRLKHNENQKGSSAPEVDGALRQGLLDNST